MKNGNFSETLKTISYLWFSGYQIRLAGVTSIEGDKYASVSPFITDFYKTLFIAVVPYELNANINDFIYDSEQDIFADFISADSIKEEWEDLAIRGTESEIGFKVDKSDLMFVCEYSRKDNRYAEYRPHTKRLYAFNNFKGNLINKDSLLKRETGNPFWIPARLLPEFIFEGHLFFLEKLIDFLDKDNYINKRDYLHMKEDIYKRKFFEKEKRKQEKEKKEEEKNAEL